MEKQKNAISGINSVFSLNKMFPGVDPEILKKVIRENPGILGRTLPTETRRDALSISTEIIDKARVIHMEEISNRNNTITVKLI